MTIKKTLISIVLAGALALGISGCRKDHSQYVYNGKIGEDQVTFTEKKYFLGSDDDNILIVKKSDGRFIRYVDRLGEDLKLENVEIKANGQTINYTANDEVGKPILAEAQKQFDVYLQKIKETRTNQGLENLK